MIDFYLGSIPKSNAYIDGKLRMALTPNVTTLCFGFFLDDDPTVLDSGSGLHIDTTKVLLGIDPADKDFNWNKAYYVTPKTFACEAIIRWMAHPENKLGKWYHAGTSRKYSRAELAQIFGTKLPEQVTQQKPHSVNVYGDFASVFISDFGIFCDEKYVKEASFVVRMWGKRQSKINE